MRSTERVVPYIVHMLEHTIAMCLRGFSHHDTVYDALKVLIDNIEAVLSAGLGHVVRVARPLLLHHTRLSTPAACIPGPSL